MPLGELATEYWFCVSLGQNPASVPVAANLWTDSLRPESEPGLPSPELETGSQVRVPSGSGTYRAAMFHAELSGAFKVGRQRSLNRTGFAGQANSGEAGSLTSKTTNTFSLEVRARAV
jgi:hypothetical protein